MAFELETQIKVKATFHVCVCVGGGEVRSQFRDLSNILSLYNARVEGKLSPHPMIVSN